MVTSHLSRKNLSRAWFHPVMTFQPEPLVGTCPPLRLLSDPHCSGAILFVFDCAPVHTIVEFRSEGKHEFTL